MRTKRNYCICICSQGAFFYCLIDWQEKNYHQVGSPKNLSCNTWHTCMKSDRSSLSLYPFFFFFNELFVMVDRSNWHIDKIQNNNWHVLGNRGHQLEDTDTASQQTWKLKEKIKSMGNILLQISSWGSCHHPNIVTIWRDPSTIGYNWWWVWISSHIYQPLDINEDLIRMKNERFMWGKLVQPMLNFTTISESICWYSYKNFDEKWTPYFNGGWTFGSLNFLALYG